MVAIWAGSRRWQIRPATATHVARIGRGLLCEGILASTRLIGPGHVDEGVKGRGKPAPVHAEAGRLRVDRRAQPPATRAEWSLEKCPSTWRMSPSVPPTTSGLQFAHRRQSSACCCRLPSTTPALAASIDRARRLGARQRPSGFSRTRPAFAGARATALTCSTCSEWGVARNTACTSGSAKRIGEIARQAESVLLGERPRAFVRLLAHAMDEAQAACLLPCTAG